MSAEQEDKKVQEKFSKVLEGVFHEVEKEVFHKQARLLYEDLYKDYYDLYSRAFGASLVKATSKEQCLKLIDKYLKDIVLKQNVIIRYYLSKRLLDMSIYEALIHFGFTKSEIYEISKNISCISTIDEIDIHKKITSTDNFRQFADILNNLTITQFKEDQKKGLTN